MASQLSSATSSGILQRLASEEASRLLLPEGLSVDTARQRPQSEAIEGLSRSMDRMSIHSTRPAVSASPSSTKIAPINRLAKLDVADPWGEAWSVDSPYDASLAYASHPARMASRQSVFFDPHADPLPSLPSRGLSPWSDASSTASTSAATSPAYSDALPLPSPNSGPSRASTSRNDSKLRSVSFHSDLGPAVDEERRAAIHRARSTSHLSSMPSSSLHMALPASSSRSRRSEVDIYDRRKSIAASAAASLPAIPVDPRLLGKQKRSLSGKNVLTGSQSSVYGDNASIRSSSRFSSYSLAPSLTKRKSAFGWFSKSDPSTPSEEHLQPQPSQGQARTSVSSRSRSAPTSPSASRTALYSHLSHNDAPPVPPMPKSPQSMLHLSPTDRTELPRKLSDLSVPSSTAQNRPPTVTLPATPVASMVSNASGQESLPDLDSHAARPEHALPALPPPGPASMQIDMMSRQRSLAKAAPPASPHKRVTDMNLARQTSPGPALASVHTPRKHVSTPDFMPPLPPSLPTLQSLMGLKNLSQSPSSTLISGPPPPNVALPATPAHPDTHRSLSPQDSSAKRPPRTSSLLSLSNRDSTYTTSSSNFDSSASSTRQSVATDGEGQNAATLAWIRESPEYNRTTSALPTSVEARLQLSKQAVRPVYVEQNGHQALAQETSSNIFLTPSASANSLVALQIPPLETADGDRTAASDYDGNRTLSAGHRGYSAEYACSTSQCSHSTVRDTAFISTAAPQTPPKDNPVYHKGNQDGLRPPSSLNFEPISPAPRTSSKSTADGTHMTDRKSQFAFFKRTKSKTMSSGSDHLDIMQLYGSEAVAPPPIQTPQLSFTSSQSSNAETQSTASEHTHGDEAGRGRSSADANSSKQTGISNSKSSTFTSFFGGRKKSMPVLTPKARTSSARAQTS